MGVNDPEKLSSMERNRKYADFLFLREYERDFQLGILKQAIAEALFGSQDNE